MDAPALSPSHPLSAQHALPALVSTVAPGLSQSSEAEIPAEIPSEASFGLLETEGPTGFSEPSAEQGGR